ncbi:MAG: [FeFe] hydrogenase H-cluster radical SAM maturase HydE [Sedimentisphaerales bacterium]|nr:[FeFe] hydrogenase H-cluster radical SAM maturase HydE [Sedimentisphaerales bacterium]
MIKQKLKYVLKNIYRSQSPTKTDLEHLLAQQGQDSTEQIMRFADEVRSSHVGDGIVLRAIIEFSSFCNNTCTYCGLNKFNTALPRYQMTREQILQLVNEIAIVGIKTIVLQSGESICIDSFWLAQIIEDIKTEFDMAITLSVGERDTEEYRLWRHAGADRYLLKIETTNPTNYGLLHPGMSFENRLRCLADLKVLGYQTGSGNIVGLKNQTNADLAQDILFFRKENFDMLGIGPFIPHPQTQLAAEPQGNLELTLRTLSLTRIVTKDTHLPATTAVGVAGSSNAVRSALTAGANVVMINFTPAAYNKLYEIYPGRVTINNSPQCIIKELENVADGLGRYISYSRADSLKNCNEDIPRRKKVLVK